MAMTGERAGYPYEYGFPVERANNPGRRRASFAEPDPFRRSRSRARRAIDKLDGGPAGSRDVELFQPRSRSATGRWTSMAPEHMAPAHTPRRAARDHDDGRHHGHHDHDHSNHHHHDRAHRHSRHGRHGHKVSGRRSSSVSSDLDSDDEFGEDNFSRRDWDRRRGGGAHHHRLDYHEADHHHGGDRRRDAKLPAQRAKSADPAWQALRTGLIAGAVEIFRGRNDRKTNSSNMIGRVAATSIGAAAIDAGLATRDPAHPGRHAGRNAFASTVGGMLVNQIANRNR